MKSAFILWLLCTVGLLSPSLQAEDTYRIRFVQTSTLKPIAEKSFKFVPRRIEQKAIRGTPDPNLQFAEPFTTDAEGILVLPEAVLIRLTAGGNNYVDTYSDSFTRYCLRREERPPAPPIHTITTFRAGTGLVAATFFLSAAEPNIILLEPHTTR